jgi:POLQ-like helicase
LFIVEGRARQLYKAGYKTLRDVANADPKQMVHSIDHMPKKTANQIIAAAKVSNFYRSSQHLQGEDGSDMFL